MHPGLTLWERMTFQAPQLAVGISGVAAAFLGLCGYGWLAVAPIMLALVLLAGLIRKGDVHGRLMSAFGLFIGLSALAWAVFGQYMAMVPLVPALFLLLRLRAEGPAEPLRRDKDGRRPLPRMSPYRVPARIIPFVPPVLRNRPLVYWMGRSRPYRRALDSFAFDGDEGRVP